MTLVTCLKILNKVDWIGFVGVFQILLAYAAIETP